MSEKIKIICVAGPTASGKTALGVKIAAAVGGEVVSADSMQIYKDMPIASAVATEEEKCGIPHHLTEFVPYGEKFTVFDYLTVARKKINEIAKSGKVPVIVGGTGLYINSLVDNIELCEEKTDMALRRRLEEEYDRVGGEEMLCKLGKIDKQAADKLHTNDRRRIIRALEIYQTAGHTKSEQDARSKTGENPYSPLIIGINYAEREKLYERINKRVDLMLESGLLKEAENAYKKYSGDTAGAVQAIGHKEFFPYFSGEISLEEAVENLKRQTRRYAKRQITWFGARNDIVWLHPDTEDVWEKTVKLLKREGYTI